MAHKKFTLIELLAVVMIFGILASIGLSISKPSQVKDNVSVLSGMIQRARADAIQNRRVSYISIDRVNLTIEVLYQDPFDKSWQNKIPGTVKTFGQGVSIGISRLTNKSWRVTNEYPAGIFFDANGHVFTPSNYASDGWRHNHDSGLKCHTKGFAIYDPENKKNVFLLEINKLGAYKVVEGQTDIGELGYPTNFP